MPIYHQNPGDDGSEIVERRPYDSFAHGLLTYASVTLYCGLAVLEDDLRRLSEEHWVATRVSAADWAQRGNAYESLFRALPLPAEWADADHLRHPYKLEEALDELRIPDAGGLALVMTDFDAFARSGSRKVRTQARDILDTLIEAARRLQFGGKSLLIMVQTNDPDLHLEELGKTSAGWNPREFVTAERGKVQP